LKQFLTGRQRRIERHDLGQGKRGGW
jgi:hypothetical protein